MDERVKGLWKKYVQTACVVIPVFLLYLLMLFWVSMIMQEHGTVQQMRAASRAMRWSGTVAMVHVLFLKLLFSWVTAREPAERESKQLTAYRVAFAANELVFLVLGCVVAAKASTIVPIPAVVWLVPVLHAASSVWKFRTWASTAR